MFLEFPVSRQRAQSALDDWVQLVSGHVQVGREGEGERERAGGYQEAPVMSPGSCAVVSILT